MKAFIKRLDNSLPLPSYKTAGSVGFDFFNRLDMVIPARGLGFLPLNAIIQTPPGHLFILIPRSSLPAKKGLAHPHGIGLIDQDFSGPQDELRLQVYNLTDQPVEVKKGERVAQGFFLKFDRVEWQEQENLENTMTRGGFGSTEGYSSH